MIDPATTAAILGGKKAALLWPLFIGMTAAKVAPAGLDFLKIWGPFLAAITAAVYMGGLFEQVRDFQVDADREHRRLEQKVHDGFERLQELNAEKWNFREYKIDKAFNAINEGGRWTFPMATKANNKISATISENSREDNVRHASLTAALVAMSKRMTRIFERMDKIEGIENDGLNTSLNGQDHPR